MRFLTFILAGSIYAAPMATTKTDLSTAFKSALEKNETFAISKTQTEQANDRVGQNFGRVLPQVSLIGSYFRQDIANAVGSLRPEQTSARFNVVQPIFRGLSDIYAYRATKAQARAQEAQEFRAKLDLYTRVADTYYSVLAAEHDLENFKSVLALSEARVKDIRARVKIGRSRRGELLAAESQLALVSAQVDGAVLALQNARENFALATGLSATTDLQDDAFKAQAHSPSLDLFLTAVEKRPDVEAQRETYEASDLLVGAAKGQHLPSIDLAGNYYLHRQGNLQNAKWDVGVTLTLPIFQGFTVQSQISETVEKRKEEELRLAQVRRAASAEIRTLFQAFKTSVLQYQTLERAAKTAEENYKVQQRDYRYGLVTNLDVLQSLNTLQETRRSYERAHYDAKLSLVKLQASAGQLPETK